MRKGQNIKTSQSKKCGILTERIPKGIVRRRKDGTEKRNNSGCL